MEASATSASAGYVASLFLLQNLFAGPFHLAVVQRPGENVAVPFNRPLAHSSTDEEMKQRIVRGGYRAAQPGLCWICGRIGRQLARQHEQVLRKRHSSRPGLFPERVLFRHTPEVVIGAKSHGLEI